MTSDVVEMVPGGTRHPKDSQDPNDLMHRILLGKDFPVPHVPPFQPDAKLPF